MPRGRPSRACLFLPERTTGGLTVASGLRKDRKPTKNLEIILDASGSMKALLGKKTRWATAQEVLAEVVAKLPADYSVGLRTYGHREASTSPKTCTDTELVVPVGPLDRARLLAAAKQLRPRGETPLVYSTLQTPADLKAAGGGIVILITDGEESCKGDLAAAAATLKDSGLDLLLNIVGFTLKNPQAQAQLGALAESTGGHYYGAQNGAALSRALLLAAVNQLPYRILDAKGAEVDKGTAGVDGKHELPPGDYKVVVSCGRRIADGPGVAGASAGRGDHRGDQGRHAGGAVMTDGTLRRLAGAGALAAAMAGAVAGQTPRRRDRRLPRSSISSPPRTAAAWSGRPRSTPRRAWR